MQQQINRQAASQLGVFIDDALPASRRSRRLDGILGAFYARWCTQKMADDAVQTFAIPSSDEPVAQRGQPS